MNADLSLDVPEVQVLINFPADPDGFYWHHRILLCRVSGASWMTLTPDHEVQQHDLSTLVHRVLNRRSPFPADIVDEVYAHDPIGRAALNGFKRQAQTMAVILGEGVLPDTESTQWVICDPNHSQFGEVVDEAMLENEATGLAFSQKGVVLKDGEEIFIERVASDQIETWKREKRLGSADVRLLGDHKDASGKRRLELATAVSLMKEVKDDDFPIAGVRACKELHEAVLGGPGNFVSYHSEWLRLSGVSRRSSAAHAHAALCEGLRLLHHYDQIDASSVAIGEHLSRWLIQIELAVERSPSAPNFDGLDILAGTSTLQDGRASTARFTEWVSTRMRERATLWKQERLFQQERRHQRGRNVAAEDDDDDDDEDAGKGGRKGKKKKKTKKPDGTPDNPSGSGSK